MNTPYNFIAAPPVVSEYDHASGTHTYWPRMEDGSYREMSDHQLRDYARRRNRNGDELIREAKHSVEKVRCIAGLKPGLYGYLNEQFLNPALVPLVEVPAAPDAPDEFITLSERLSQLMAMEFKPDQRERWINGAEQRTIRQRLVEIFKEVRQVKPVGGAYAHPWRLLNMSRHLGSFPDDDHCQLFRGKGGFIWTSQPYGLSAAEILGFAHRYHLAVTASPKWSWHYPGHSTLIEWRAK